MVVTILVAGVAGYCAFLQKDSGGTPGSQFTYTLTHTTTSINVPKGSVLVVIPLGANENSNLTFKPLNLKVESGVNNTLLFYDNDTYEHIVETTEWPSGGSPFQVFVLPHKTSSVTLNGTGLYQYNFEIGTPLKENGTVTVVPG